MKQGSSLHHHHHHYQSMVNKLPPELECPVDHVLINFIDTHLAAYYHLGFSPNMVTTLSIVFGFWAAYLITKRRLHLAAIIFFISYYFDCVDGKLARKYNMMSKFGDFYDHFGDVSKFSAVLFALFTYPHLGPAGLNMRQFLLIAVIGLCTALSFVHMGYQETIYDTDESWTLNGLRRLVALDPHPQETIRLTRYFGCGTLALVTSVVVCYWA
jgi:phosphatidylglycerophosphate synthase